jgi:hypothetical protein
MTRSHIKWLTAILITLVAFALASSMTKPIVAEAKRKPTRTPTPLPTATPAPVELTAPTLISPPNGATVSGQVTFVWSAVPGAACYHLQAGLHPYLDTQSNVFNEGCLTDTSYSFYASAGFVEYFPQLYWRVRARTTTDIYGTYGPWSEVWYFNLTSP